ncbi:sulfite exporter TauE/SafE family protein [Mitsuokella sp. AF33-22]|uniref:sulfite exporter TauE/SafE family protein n=1 Tax=Mitsuokella sp. AF33-22 TaxID=2292047 RepID=UPI000E52B8F4|nr:sulfite exporter TauE/SafE family protein [Mitsuokella sp. AF33-22]RHM57674.1 sulfite exporter TauE/SafE family protein [Mitsuokella sp. AF33-22]
MDIILFLVLGVGVGVFGTLVGIGGGLICVPIFILCMSEGGIYPYFHTAGQIAGTSLVVVFANALSGTLAYIRQKRVFFNAAIPFAIATLPGAILGSYIVNRFSTPMLDLYFGIFLLIMSIIMYWNSTHKPATDLLELPKDFQYNRTIGIIASLGVGFLSSIFGIGGGVIHVPLMIYLLGFPVHVATATSHFVLACSSAFGVVSHYMLNHIVWIPAICISIGAAIGAQIGAKISRKTKSKVILTLLSLAMFALGLRLILLGSAH